MANKKAKKPAKPLGKTAMKKTKGGAVDAFIWFKPTESLMPTDQISLNFEKR
ncbi:MAG TPA: hypothetical protein VF950_25550 [Planctomycetota bacterium]